MDAEYGRVVAAQTAEKPPSSGERAGRNRIANSHDCLDIIGSSLPCVSVDGL